MTTACPPSSPTSSRSPTGASRTEAERYAKRLASTMDELQAFYDAAFPRLDDAMAYLDRSRPRRAARRRHAPAVAVLLAGERVVPGRGVAPAAGARQRRGQHGRGRRARGLSRGSRRAGRSTEVSAVLGREPMFTQEIAALPSVGYALRGDERRACPPTRPSRTAELARAGGGPVARLGPDCGPRAGCSASSTPPSS